MKPHLVLVVVVSLGCSKEKESPPPSAAVAAPEAAPAAPAAEVEDVDCDTAGKEYAKKMAATPGNVLSDAKPDSGLVYFAGISMADYCIGEGGMIVPWTKEQRACVKNAAMDANAVSACFTGDALSQVNAGLNEVVTSALANKKANEAQAAQADAAP